MDGHLRLPAEVARAHFRWDRARVLPASYGLALIPTAPNVPDGLILKQRNLVGDRAVMVRSVLPDEFATGTVAAKWNAALRQLEVRL